MRGWPWFGEFGKAARREVVAQGAKLGWENRGGRLYFYTKERNGASVISRYFGCGETAQLIGQISALRRKVAEGRKAQAAEEIDAMKAEDEAADDNFSMVNNLMSKALIAEGFHQHNRGEWRRKRCQRKSN